MKTDCSPNWHLSGTPPYIRVRRLYPLYSLKNRGRRGGGCKIIFKKTLFGPIKTWCLGNSAGTRGSYYFDKETYPNTVQNNRLDDLEVIINIQSTF